MRLMLAPRASSARSRFSVLRATRFLMRATALERSAHDLPWHDAPCRVAGAPCDRRRWPSTPARARACAASELSAIWRPSGLGWTRSLRSRSSVASCSRSTAAARRFSTRASGACSPSCSLLAAAAACLRLCFLARMSDLILRSARCIEVAALFWLRRVAAIWLLELLPASTDPGSNPSTVSRNRHARKAIASCSGRTVDARVRNARNIGLMLVSCGAARHHPSVPVKAGTFAVGGQLVRAYPGGCDRSGKRTDGDPGTAHGRYGCDSPARRRTRSRRGLM